MQVLLVIGPFLVLGIIVAVDRVRGQPGAAREAYLTRGGRAFTSSIFLIYLGLGIAVPAAVIASRGEAEGGVGRCGPRPPRRARSTARALHRQPARAATTWTPSRRAASPAPTSTSSAGSTAARAERDQERRHRPEPDAGRTAPGPGRPGRGRLRGAGRRPVAALVAATRVTESPAACGGFSVRRVVCAASMRRVNPSRGPVRQWGVGDPDGREAGGESSGSGWPVRAIRLT